MTKDEKSPKSQGTYKDSKELCICLQVTKELKPKQLFDERMLSDYIPANTKRYQHILGVVEQTKHLSDRIEIEEELKPLLIQAAYLHDIGYSDRLNHTKFHPLDGAVFAQQLGFSKPVVASILFHSGAYESVLVGRPDLIPIYSANYSLLDEKDQLFIELVTYCDLHTSPNGESISFEDRILDIVQRYGEDHEVSRFMVGNRANFIQTIQRVESLIIK